MSSEVFKAIAQRRTVKPTTYTDQDIPENVLQEILESANWAPNHGRTEPWRLTVFKGEGKIKFQQIIKEMFDAHPEANFPPEKLNKWLKNAIHANVIVAVGMKRTEPCKIPVVEELCAVASAAQNMLITAQAYGIASYWGSSVSHLAATPKALGLDGPHDQVLGFLHFGYPREAICDGARKSSIDNKITWFTE